jgi:MFS transporter, FHS family, glucose/mannose:H+ symporter
VRLVRTLLAIHLVSFPTGGAQALYGPSLPAVAERFALPVSTVGMLLGAHAAGAMVGILLWAVLQRSFGPHRFAAAAAGALGAGLLLLAAAPLWPLMLLGAALTGCGFGGVAAGLNMYIAGLFPRRRAALLTSAAASFGLGSIAGPALLGQVGPGGHRTVYIALAVVALAASPLLLTSTATRPAAAPVAGARRPPPVALLFMLALGLYVSVEVGIGGWMATHLIGVGEDPGAAARWTAAFWTAFTLGRLLATPVALRVSAPVLTIAAVAAGAAALLLAVSGGTAVAGYLLAGLALAPVFPALFAWFSEVTAPSTLTGALFFAAGSLGAAALPPFIGLLADRFGPLAIPAALALLASACAAVLVALTRSTAPRNAAPAGRL